MRVILQDATGRYHISRCFEVMIGNWGDSSKTMMEMRSQNSFKSI